MLSFIEPHMKPGTLSVEGKFMASLCRMRRKSSAVLLGAAFEQKNEKIIRRWHRQITFLLDGEEDSSFRKKHLGPHVFPPKVK